MTPLFKFVVCFFATTVVRSSLVNVRENGGYRDVVIAISPHINASDIAPLLFKLEALFREVSKLLYIATRNQSYFEEIVFVLPKSADISTFGDRAFNVERKYASRPDIMVLNEGIFQNQPYTTQHAGCGEPGRRISIPLSFFITPELHKNARAVVHEWAHYRYGVFDERGFLGDTLYPLVFTIPGQSKTSEQVFITECTNQKAIYNFRNASGFECEALSNACYPVPDEMQNNHIVSSLMGQTSFPKLSQFCDGEKYPHNRNAPTKQNALCREQSTWKIISQHDDFKKRTSKDKTISPIKFKYTLESDPKIILAIDSTSNMAKNGRIDLVRNSFSNFVLYDLPKNSKAGIINLKYANANPFFVTLKSSTDSEKLLDAFPEAYGNGETCIHCGILKALEVFKYDSKLSLASGTVIIATTVDISEQWMENVTKSLDKADVRIFVIFFSESVDNSTSRLEKLATLTGGRFFYIKENLENHTFLSPLTFLYETFRAIYETFSWTYRNKVLVDQKVFHHNSSENAMSFIIDDTIESFQLLLTGPNFLWGPPVIKDSVILRHEDDVYAAGNLSFSHKIKIPAYVFSIDNPRNGTWNFSFDRKPGHNMPLIVMIRASQSSSRGILQAHCWINSNKGSEIFSSKPFTIYAEIHLGAKPLLNANVVAVILHPESGKETILELFDRGEGDPDITRNDGIYSRYFTGMSVMGYYILNIKVYKHTSDAITSSFSGNAEYCCGSSLPDNVAASSTEFHRVTTYGSFYMDVEILNHNFAPRRIVDLSVVNVQTFPNDVKHFTLQWTAPGNDYDNGLAAEYELKVFHNRDEALTNFETGQVLTIDEWKIHGPWLHPKPAGTLENTIIQLSNITTGSYFIALRAVDTEGNSGDVSNVVQVYFTEPSLPPPVVISTSFSPFTFEPDNGLSSTLNSIDPNSEQLHQADVSIAIGVACGILFLLLIIGVVLFVFLVKRRKLKDIKKESISPPYAPRKTGPNTISQNIDLVRNNPSANFINPLTSNEAEPRYHFFDKLQETNFCNDRPPPILLGSLYADDVSLVSYTDSKLNILDQSSSLYDVPYMQQTPMRDNDVPYIQTPMRDDVPYIQTPMRDDVPYIQRPMRDDVPYIQRPMRDDVPYIQRPMRDDVPYIQQTPIRDDVPYMQQTPMRDNDVNFPFNPMYTSSLRRLHGNENRSYQLGTDV